MYVLVHILKSTLCIELVQILKSACILLVQILKSTLAIGGASHVSA